MRTSHFSNPARRGPKPLRPIRRGALPRARLPLRQGDRRQRWRYALGLWARLVKGKELSGLCPVCGKRRWFDAMHCWAKGSYRALSLEPSNGAPGCRPCHRRLDSDHHAKREFFIGYMGSVEYERLRLMAMGRARLDVDMAIMELEAETRKWLTSDMSSDAANAL